MENTTDTLQIIINEARAKLSKESREAIDSVNWKLTILGMDTKYNQDQLENLETETELLLCGILNPEIYPIELETRMHLTKEEVGLLIGEMDKLIFKKIQEDLEKRLAEKDKTITPTITPKPLDFDPRFMSMPKEVEEAIAKSGWKEKLYEIAGKYKLTVEQKGVLEEMTVKVMSNEVHPDKYEEELASKITIAKEDVSNLVKDVNEEILKVIREGEKGEITNYEPALSADRLRITNDTKPIEKEDEIPLPPYAKDVLKDAWPVKPIKIEPKIIETPTNIIEEKLKTPTVSVNTVSDHTNPRISDPYHEPIE